MATHQTPCEICERISQCSAGTHPGLIAELDTGFAVLGDSQQFRGYSILLCKTPVTELHELDQSTRLRYLQEMSQLAESVGVVTSAHKLNYECLGNMVHHLHFHVFPRQASEAKPTLPVWVQMVSAGSSEAAACKLDAKQDAELIANIREQLALVRKRDEWSETVKGVGLR
jgi:diadenosine tetraphosphate (Ap4A) HIT family hydrolase